jgi:hypothetical protein
MTDGKAMAGKTCNDWTSDSKDQQAQVGHADGSGLGPPAAIRPADTPFGTRQTKTAAAPTRLRAAEAEGFIVSWRSNCRC